MTGVAAWIFWVGYRYYMFHKTAATWNYLTPEEV
jgi:hypothetical protein